MVEVIHAEGITAIGIEQCYSQVPGRYWPSSPPKKDYHSGTTVAQSGRV